MAVNEKSLANLIYFKAGQSGNPYGRPKKLLSDINSELISEGYVPASDYQLVEAYKLLLNCDEEKLKALQADKTTPFFLRRVILHLGTAKGMEVLDKIYDRSFGRTKQSLDITTNSESLNKMPDLSKLTFEQLKELANDNGTD